MPGLDPGDDEWGKWAFLPQQLAQYRIEPLAAGLRGVEPCVADVEKTTLDETIYARRIEAVGKGSARLCLKPGERYPFGET